MARINLFNEAAYNGNGWLQWHCDYLPTVKAIAAVYRQQMFVEGRPCSVTMSLAWAVDQLRLHKDTSYDHWSPDVLRAAETRYSIMAFGRVNPPRRYNLMR